ncbi:MAG: formylglycine-generating enzyme family protein [Anaerolineae bacterium]|nr:formylglycine-generating enzyme family protein [Anaerolineae bacterium]
MVVLPAGSFRMGSPPDEAGRYADEGPVRTITIAHPFAVGRYEITRGQYREFVRDTGYRHLFGCFVARGENSQPQLDGEATWTDPGFEQDDDEPAVCISWYDAQAYIRWLNRRTGGGYRLLTESEWEYAARAGESGPFGVTGESELCLVANHADALAVNFAWRNTACTDGSVHTAAVGSLRPNLFGLYDMLGNAMEWVEDCYTENLGELPTNGAAFTRDGCRWRVERGGAWHGEARATRFAARTGDQPAMAGAGLGFRVGKTL